jgi:hypothetical protein
MGKRLILEWVLQSVLTALTLVSQSELCALVDALSPRRRCIAGLHEVLSPWMFREAAIIDTVSLGDGRLA